MKIVCPSCDATYEVPEVVVTSRRAVRCARCGNNWAPGDTDGAQPEQAASHSPAMAHERSGDPEAAGAAFEAERDSRPPHSHPTLAEEQVAEPAHPVAMPAMDGFAPPPQEPAPEQAPEPVTETQPEAAGPLSGPQGGDGPEQPDAHALAPEEIEQAEEPAHFRPMPVRAAPVVPPRESVAPPQTEPQGAPVLAWVGSLALVLAMAAALFVFRQPVMHAWPPSTRLYAAMGLYQPEPAQAPAQAKP